MTTSPNDDEDLELFTPRVREGTRLRLFIAPDEAKLITRGPGYKGQVRDAYTGTLYDVWGAPCSATFPDGHGCFCDAIAERIDEEIDA